MKNSIMAINYVVGIIVTLVGCTGNRQATNDQRINNTDAQKEVNFKSGLMIENGINRGTDYTDSSGRIFNIRYIPVSITNESSNSILVEIDFLNEYDNPVVSGCPQFNVIPMPLEWGMNGVEITEDMMGEIPEYIRKPTANITLEPGESYIFAIGTRYLRSSSCVAPVPSALFVQSDGNYNRVCDYVIDQPETKRAGSALALHLDLNRDKPDESCMIIPCGSITHNVR